MSATVAGGLDPMQSAQSHCARGLSRLRPLVTLTLTAISFPLSKGWQTTT